MANEGSDYVWILVVGTILMFGMAFLIGANDVANTFGTSVGSGALSIPVASCLAAVFEIIGATALGGTVSKSIRDNTVEVAYFENMPEMLMFGMLCSLVGAVTWLTIATYNGWPVSTTHSIVGSIIGFGIASKGDVDWEGFGMIVLSWFVSPILAGIFAAITYSLIRLTILRTKDPVKFGLRLLWLLIFVVCLTFVLFIVYKNSWNIPNVSCNVGGSEPETPCPVSDWAVANIGEAIGVSIGVAAGLTIILSGIFYWYCLNQLKKFDTYMANKGDFADQEAGATDDADSSTPNAPVNAKQKFLSIVGLYRNINVEGLKESGNAKVVHKSAERFDDRTEKFFSTVQVLSACFDSLAHGANDVANAVSPYATILYIYETGSAISEVGVEYWVLFVGGLAIAFGLFFFGVRVMKTIGVKLCKITPSRGTSIELGAAWVVIIFTNLGVPLSTTHCQVGATVGVGLLEKWKVAKNGMRYPSGVNLTLLAKVFLGWVATVIIAALVTATVFSFGAYAPTLLAPIGV